MDCYKIGMCIKSSYGIGLITSIDKNGHLSGTWGEDLIKPGVDPTEPCSDYFVNSATVAGVVTTYDITTWNIQYITISTPNGEVTNIKNPTKTKLNVGDVVEIRGVIDLCGCFEAQKFYFIQKVI